MSEAEAPPGPALLVVDDEPQVLALIPQLFRGEFPVLTARSGEEALARLAEQEVGVVVADQRMPEMVGTELLGRIAAERPDVVRILLTAYADIESLLEAINTGRVYQFITKPWENRELAVLIRRAMETYRLRTQNAQLLAENVRLVGELRTANENLESENRVLRREVGERYKLGNLIGASPAMEQTFRLLEKAGQSQANVLLVGETGTGKELAAGCIHHTSPRRARKFVAVNCAAMPESLLESELFGHVKGAFTGALRDRRGVFEEASGGTIFLGASESVRVDVRLICATHRDLKAEVEAGRFRRDLFYRVNVFPVPLPPLRARQGDVRLLVQHFFEKYDAAAGKALRGFTPAALSALERYGWPGNVRELRNEIERAVALAEPGETIDLAHLSGEVSGDEALAAVAEGDGKLRERLDRIEQLLILQELRRHGDNRTRTARHLGISVRALQKKIGKYGLRQGGE